MSSDFEINDLVIVEHYCEIGNYKKAEELMMQLFESSPENPQYLYYMAIIQFHLDNMDIAEEFCLRSLGSGNYDEEGLYLLGLINIERKKYAQAEKNLLDSLHINPENHKVLAVYGYLMLLTGYDQKAEKLILEALRIDPDDPMVLEIGLEYYLVKNKKEQQLQFLNKYIQHSDNEIGKLVRIGINELMQNNYKAARENLVQAFLLNPTNHDILSAIEEIDKDCHPIFFPQRVIRKLGGPAIIWIGFVVSLILFKLLHLLSIAAILAVIYILICVYSWVTPFIYKYFFKR